MFEHVRIDLIIKVVLVLLLIAALVPVRIDVKGSFPEHYEGDKVNFSKLEVETESLLGFKMQLDVSKSPDVVDDDTKDITLKQLYMTKKIPIVVHKIIDQRAVYSEKYVYEGQQFDINKAQVIALYDDGTETYTDDVKVNSANENSIVFKSGDTPIVINQKFGDSKLDIRIIPIDHIETSISASEFDEQLQNISNVTIYYKDGTEQKISVDSVVKSGQLYGVDESTKEIDVEYNGIEQKLIIKLI